MLVESRPVNAALVILASFLASSVEMVEALTIVLAVGLTNGWRTALLGVAAAIVALTVVVAVLGSALVDYVPIETLQVVIGVLLLIFGLQWLRKAILRASGLKAKHDEDKIFQEELADLTDASGTRQDLDWTGFVVSFKGVFLEGLEVAFIVLTFGLNRGEFALSAIGAFLAFAIVALIGALVHRPLARVPENAIKFSVGILLVSFGTFWGGEGLGVEWSLQDGMIPVLVVLYTLIALGLVSYLRPATGHVELAIEGAHE